METRSEIPCETWLKPIVALLGEGEFGEAYALAAYFPNTRNRQLVQFAALLGQNEFSEANTFLKKFAAETQSLVTEFATILSQVDLNLLDTAYKAIENRHFKVADFCIEFQLLTHPETSLSVVLVEPPATSEDGEEDLVEPPATSEDDEEYLEEYLMEPSVNMQRLIERHTRIEFPSECVLEQKAELKIQLTQEIPKFTRVQEKIALTVESNTKQVKLNVKVTAPAFAIRPYQQRLTVPVKGDSNEVTFTLFPLEKGKQVIEIEFFKGATRVGYVLVQTYVSSYSYDGNSPKALSMEDPIDGAYLQGMNFEGCQYVIYRHTDTQHDHIHIVANRIRITDGSVVSDSWNYRRGEMVVRQLEEQFGLPRTPCSWEKSKKSPTTGEIRRQRRTGKMNQRSQLQDSIKQSLNESISLDEFIDRLSAKGMSFRLRKSKEGKIQGISYGLDGVAFQGRQLGKDYSWTSLESVLAQETSNLPSQSDLISQQYLMAVATLTTEDREAESNSLEQQKKRLRDKYISLAAQVRKSPEFQHREMRDIDVGVTLLALKIGNSLEEAKIILTQSDAVRQWHQELPREAFLDIAKQYIWQVTNKANALLQKHRDREKSAELE